MSRISMQELTRPEWEAYYYILGAGARQLTKMWPHTSPRAFFADTFQPGFQNPTLYIDYRPMVVTLYHFSTTPCHEPQFPSKSVTCLALVATPEGEERGWMTTHPVGECPWKIRRWKDDLPTMRTEADS